MTGGMHRGEIWVIAGKSGGGKTSLGLQLARNFSDNPEHSILFLSLEMRGWELVLRMYCEMMGANYFDVTTGKVGIDRRDCDRFEDFLMSIDMEIVEYGYTFTEVKKVIQTTYQTKKPDIIFLDFIQLIDWQKFKDERLALVEYSRKIKELANTLNVGFVVVSQLRRLPSGANYNRPPDMTDLKGSGSLEQSADKVILIHKEIDENDYEEHYINLAKNRQGRTGKQRVIFEGEHYRFKDFVVESDVAKAVIREFNGSVM